MTKHAELRLLLRRAFSDIIHTTNTISEHDFISNQLADKWSIAEIIGHLILSTKAVTKGLSTPKPMLASAFGKMTREEWTNNELTDAYHNALSNGLQAPSAFIYKNANTKGKEQMLSAFNRELDLLLDALDRWNEYELSEYVLPHPAIGNMSLREMILFTEFHTRHHHKQIITLSETLEKVS